MAHGHCLRLAGTDRHLSARSPKPSAKPNAKITSATPDISSQRELALDRVISVASYREAGTVIAGRRRTGRLRATDDLDRLLQAAGIRVAAVTVEQGRLALCAPIRHGRGAGCGGAVNFGDRFSYTLAMETAPLLSIGDDFPTMDGEIVCLTG